MSIDYIFKIVIGGDTNAGKTSFCECIQGSSFQNKKSPTIGVEFFSNVLSIDGVHIKNQIWDVSGDEKFRSILTPYFRGTCGVMLFFDVSDIDSFHHLSDWTNKFIKEKIDVPIIIVGNKTDQPRVISKSYAEGFARDNNYFYSEMSVKDYSNVSETYKYFIRKIYERINDIKGIQKITPDIIINDKDDDVRMNCGKCTIC